MCLFRVNKKVILLQTSVFVGDYKIANFCNLFYQVAYSIITKMFKINYYLNSCVFPKQLLLLFKLN